MKKTAHHRTITLTLALVLMTSINGNTQDVENPENENKSGVAIELFTAGVRTSHSLSQVIEESHIEPGMGFSAGMGMHFSQFLLSVSYTSTDHTYDIQGEETGLSFTALSAGAGLEFTRNTRLTPWAQAVFGATSLRDSKKDGFNDGFMLGMEGGIKVGLVAGLQAGIAAGYYMNSYKTFSVPEQAYFDTNDVKGDYYSIKATLSYRIEF